MSTFNYLLATLSIITVAYSIYSEEPFKDVDIQTEEDATMHIFVLMVPETTVQALRIKGRQEEAEAVAAGSQVVTQTGSYVAQILTGVLGGDVRPIFAGSFNFIGNMDVRNGVNTIFGAITPVVNGVMRQWIARASVALGLATSTVTPSNQTGAGGGIVVGRPISAAQASRLTPAQILQQQLVQPTPAA